MDRRERQVNRGAPYGVGTGGRPVEPVMAPPELAIDEVYETPACPSCGYSLHAHPASGNCPECGVAYVTSTTRPRSRRHAQKSDVTGALVLGIASVMMLLFTLATAFAPHLQTMQGAQSVLAMLPLTVTAAAGLGTIQLARKAVRGPQPVLSSLATVLLVVGFATMIAVALTLACLAALIALFALSWIASRAA